jgi:hypothetical protein
MLVVAHAPGDPMHDDAESMDGHDVSLPDRAFAASSCNQLVTN